MDRVNDLTKLKMCMGSVLIRIKMKTTKISAPGDTTPKSLVEYAEVIALSPDVTDLAVGDVVLDFRTTEGFDCRGEKYCIIPRMMVKVAVSPDNFTSGMKVDKRILN